MVNLVLMVVIAAGSLMSAYLYGYQRGATPLRAQIVQMQSEHSRLAKRYEKATRTVDNLIEQLESQPIPEAPRVKETIRYIRIKEPRLLCLGGDTVRMLRNIRDGRGAADALTPKESTQTSPKAARSR